MSVTNYTPDKCKYSIGKLVKSVWLVSEEAIKDIRIDNGEAWVESVSETPIRLDCYSIELTDTDTLDERYKFTHTLTFSVNGYANKDDFQGRYYAIVKDDEGTYWLVNPLFPCKVTYTYTLGNEQNHTDFTMSTASNHPVLKLNGMVDSSTYECNEYWLDGIDALWLNEKRYTVHSGNHVMYTNGGFKTVEYNSKSATFTETFDGTNTSHGIEFDVLFSEYKKSWHYNLLEFKDNLYASVIKTRNNKYALCGFSLGMQPGFQVSANDTNNQIDRIHITLNDAHDVGDSIEFYDSIEYEYLSAKTYDYTSEYDGYECVEDGVAKYLLQKEIDALGNETGNFKVLEGYADNFPTLNLVGSFSDIVLFANTECIGYGMCELETSLSNLVFNEVDSTTLYLRCDSDWSIESSAEHIIVSPSSGQAGVEYNIVVSNTKEPSSSAETSTLTLSYCFNKQNIYNVKVREYDGCLTKGFRYWIDAVETLLTVPSKCCISKVSETTAVGVVVTLYTNNFTVLVPQNLTRNNRTILLVVEYCDGSSQTVEIHQDSVFIEWREEGEHFCIYSNEYKRERMYSGYTPSEMVITDETRDIFVEAGSELCDGVLYRWVATGEEGCEGCDTGGFMAISSAKPYTSNPIGGQYNGSLFVTKGACYECGNFFPVITAEDPAASSVASNFYLCLGDDMVSFWSNEESGCTTVLKDIYNYLNVGGGYQNEIVLPPRVTGFPNSIFSGSTAVQITLPNMIEYIPSMAFQSCRYLKTLVLGSGITSIENNAFYDGVNVTSTIENIIINATTPPVVYSRSFDGLSNDIKIFVPASALADYKTAPGWSNYQNKIYAIE